MPKAEIFTTAFYDKWMWKAHREGEAIGEVRGEARGEACGEAKMRAATLRTEIGAIRQVFTRRHLNWRAYGKDICKLPDYDHASEFLIDLALAKDPAAFLRRKFGH